MAATMLHKEYGLTRSPWYSIGGYTIATCIGMTRQMNNKHWLSDVLMGAGIGILSTELGYFRPAATTRIADCAGPSRIIRNLTTLVNPLFSVSIRVSAGRTGISRPSAT